MGHTTGGPHGANLPLPTLARSQPTLSNSVPALACLLCLLCFLDTSFHSCSGGDVSFIVWLSSWLKSGVPGPHGIWFRCSQMIIDDVSVVLTICPTPRRNMSPSATVWLMYYSCNPNKLEKVKQRLECIGWKEKGKRGRQSHPQRT